MVPKKYFLSFWLKGKGVFEKYKLSYPKSKKFEPWWLTKKNCFVIFFRSFPLVFWGQKSMHFIFYTNFLSSLKIVKLYFNDFYLNLNSTKEKIVSTKTAPSIENFTNLFIFQYCKNVCRKLNSQVSFIILLFFQRIENSFLSKQINFICEKYKKINKKYN